MKTKSNISIKIIELSFILAILMFVLILTSGCEKNTESKKDFVGTEIIKQPENQFNNSENNIVNNADTKNQTVAEVKKEESKPSVPDSKVYVKNTTQTNSSSQKPAIKSISRLTKIQPDKIGLNEGDFDNLPEAVLQQTKNISKQGLMLYDGYDYYLKEGYISTFKYDPDGDYENPRQLVSCTILRYETDYIDNFIKNKKFDSNKVKFNTTVGEYSIGHYEYPNGMYQSVYTIEFVKYDIYVKVIVASKDWIVLKDDVAKYAREIEARIRK